MRCEQCRTVFEPGETYIEFDNDRTFCNTECFIEWNKEIGLVEKVVGEDE
jgi:hypothetical protein